jgi:hypothetical protein
MIFGQAGGVVLILAMDLANSIFLSFFWAMVLLIGLDLIALLISFLLVETAKGS